METLCGLFGKKRQWYYASHNHVISERQRRKLLTVSVEYYRWLWPRLGGVKLHLILKEELGVEVTGGRDSFLRFLSDEGFVLPKLKRRRTLPIFGSVATCSICTLSQTYIRMPS